MSFDAGKKNRVWNRIAAKRQYLLKTDVSGSAKNSELMHHITNLPLNGKGIRKEHH